MKTAVQLFNEHHDSIDKTTGVACLSLGYFFNALTEHDKEIISKIDEMMLVGFHEYSDDSEWFGYKQALTELKQWLNEN